MSKSRQQSQSIPKKSFELPKYITNTVQVLEFFSYRLALKFVLKLFFSPIRFRRPKREEEIYASANKQILKNKLGHDFELMIWGDKNSKSILLVHGWSGRGTQFHQVIESLLKDNWRVISFDAPGHGNSKLKTSNLLEFTYCCLEICQKFGPLEHAIGHSLGGGALFNALDRGADFKSIVCIGTPATIPMVVEDFALKVKASPKIAKGILKTIERNFEINVEEISSNVLAYKHQPKGLIIHDTEDLDVAVENAFILKKSWTNAELLISTGYGHRKIINHPDSVKKIQEFLNS